MHLSRFLAIQVLLLSAIAAPAQLGTCPYVIANYPFSATMVQTMGTSPALSLLIARDRSGSVRCGIPQPGRDPDTLELVDVAHKQEILFGCAEVLTDSHRGSVSSCQGQRVQVRPLLYHAPILSDAEIENRLEQLASTPPNTRTEGTVTEENRTLGQRFVNGVLCVGFQRVRQGTEVVKVKRAETQQRRLDYENEYCVSPLYGTLESSGYDRLLDVREKMELQNFRLGDPSPKLFELPPEYAETFAKALASPTQTASTPAAPR